MKKFFSATYLLSSIFIALGAVGHSLFSVEKIKSVHAAVKADPAVFKLIIAVWHFAGACMVLLGILAVFAWSRISRGEKSLLVIPVTIGLFYLLYGIAALVYTGSPFFAVFIVPGALLFLSAMVIRKN